MIFLTREEWMKRLGENLRERRLRANLSQQTLAERSDVSLNAVKNLESGRGAAVFSLVSVCRTLGTMDGSTRSPPNRSRVRLRLRSAAGCGGARLQSGRGRTMYRPVHATAKDVRTAR